MPASPPTPMVSSAKESARQGSSREAPQPLELTPATPLSSMPYVEVSARQVFDVQWSFSGKDSKELNASEFKRPAGTGPSGGFFRPVVDQDNDYYRLLVSERSDGQFQLRHYGENGELKHQLTSFGQIKAISKDVILYSGDAQYGTLITLKKRYNYGTSAKFSGLAITPSKETILEAFRAFQADRMQGGGTSRGDTGCSAPSSPEVALLKELPQRPSMFSLGCEESRRVRVQFNPRVSTVFQRNMCEIAPERKADIWWTQEDFAEFLKVRVQIGKVYRQAARQMGVDILKVSSEGSLRVEGYMQMVKEFPELAQESRRGLGLGRKKERARNKDAYIAAVLKEQSRQRSLWERGFESASSITSTTEEPSEASESEEMEVCRLKLNDELSDSARPRGYSSEAETTAPTTPRSSSVCTTPPNLSRRYIADGEALARVAMAISKKDRDYAHFLAKTYYEQDRIQMVGDSTMSRQSSIGHEDASNSAIGSGDELEDPSSPASARRPQRKNSDDCFAVLQEDNADLKDEDEEDVGNGRKEACFSKGYGLSREKLLEVGLSATGHAVSRSRRAKSMDWSPSNDGESETESCCDEGASDWEA